MTNPLSAPQDNSIPKAASRKDPVVFYGSDYRICELIMSLPKHCLVGVICEYSSNSSEIRDFCFMRDIRLALVRDRPALERLEISNRTLGISCGFGLIFTDEFIKKHDPGIINIHFGKLPEYRGRHPLSFAMLNNDWTIGVTAHLIDERIDQGVLLAESSIRRSLRDNINDLHERIISNALPQLLPEAVKKSESTEGLLPIPEGCYHKSLVGQFKGDLNSKDYDARFLFNLIKSQSIYGGVTINGHQWLDCHFLGMGEKPSSDTVTAECEDGVTIARSLL
jgi:hypothetical protein